MIVICWFCLLSCSIAASSYLVSLVFCQDPAWRGEQGRGPTMRPSSAISMTTAAARPEDLRDISRSTCASHLGQSASLCQSS